MNTMDLAMSALARIHLIVANQASMKGDTTMNLAYLQFSSAADKRWCQRIASLYRRCFTMSRYSYWKLLPGKVDRGPIIKKITLVINAIH
jgi:hypothetical protein